MDDTGLWGILAWGWLVHSSRLQACSDMTVRSVAGRCSIDSNSCEISIVPRGGGKNVAVVADCCRAGHRVPSCGPTTLSRMSCIEHGQSADWRVAPLRPAVCGAENVGASSGDHKA